MPIPVEELALLAPEYWLAALGVLLVLLDLFTGDDQKVIVGWTAIAGLALSLIPILGMFGAPGRTVFFNTYAVDGFAVFFKIIIVVSAILVILSAMDYFRKQTRFEGELYALLTFTTLG